MKTIIVLFFVITSSTLIAQNESGERQKNYTEYHYN